MNKIRKSIIIMALIISFSMILTACGRNTKDNGKINIVTTLFPEYDFAKEIAGDKANVSLLLKPGIEAHSFDPAPSDIVDINESDLFIYTGDYMETWAASIINSLEKDVNILNVSDGINFVKTEEEHHEEDEEDEEHTENEDGHNHVYDPHVWTSPVNAKIMVNNILNELIKIDPDNSDYYNKNAEEYIDKLNELDSKFRELVDGADIKTIYFAGKFAMYYFTNEYGLDYISAFDSCTSETEPSAKMVAHIVDEVKKNNAPAVYYEELSNHKAADTISKETGTEELLLHSCHNVSKEEFDAGATYLSLMNQNIVNLKKGLYINE